MNRNIILGISLILVCTLFALSSSVVQASMLQFTDIEVKVDNEREVGVDLLGGAIDVKPESIIELKVGVENKFESQDALTEIRSIEITTTLEEIDDGDDLDWESDSFDLKAGRQKIVTQAVRIPLIVNQNRPFKLLLKAEGRDRNGTTYTDQLDYTIHIEKDAHDVRILEAKADPAQADCNTKSDVVIVVINAGKSEEKDVNLVASNSLLGILFNETFDLSDDVRDADNEFKTHYTIPAGSLPSGTHEIFMNLDYNDHKKSNERIVNITVTPCASNAPETTIETMPVTATPITLMSKQVHQPSSSQLSEEANEGTSSEGSNEQTFQTSVSQDSSLQASQSVIAAGSVAPAILSTSTASQITASQSSTVHTKQAFKPQIFKRDSLWMILFITVDVVLVLAACAVFALRR